MGSATALAGLVTHKPTLSCLLVGEAGDDLLYKKQQPLDPAIVGAAVSSWGVDGGPNMDRMDQTGDSIVLVVLSHALPNCSTAETAVNCLALARTFVNGVAGMIAVTMTCEGRALSLIDSSCL